jgi:hypothetical protein
MTTTTFQPLHRTYALRNEAEIAAFLHQYPFIEPLLQDAPGHIRAHFPESALSLEAYYDPEDNFDQIILWVETNLEPSEALAQRDAFYEQWWFDALAQIQRRLTINLEYV